MCSFLTHLGECLYRVRIGSISVSGCWPSAEILVLDFRIDSRCVIVDITVVLLLDDSNVFHNLDDCEFQL
jgi:hypothetical protein